MGVSDIFQMLFPLFLITLLLGVVWYFVSKKKFIGNFSKYNSLPIDIITVKSIMPKKYVAAIKVDDKLLILGISEHSINLLQEKEFDANLLLNPNGEKVKSKFHELLKNNWPGK
jgi:flagellar biogenesis protein FliO